MRVIVSSSPGYGHVLPMVPLARALLAAGHEVLWGTGRDACLLVSAAGIDSRPAGLSDRQREGVRRDLVAGAAGVRPDELEGHIFPRLFRAACAPKMLTNLLSLARAWQPDLLVHEQGELAAPLVAALLGIPHVTHAYGGATPPEIVRDAGEQTAPLWAEHGQALPVYAGCYRYLYLDICPTSVQTVSVAHIANVQPLRPGSYAGKEPDPLAESLYQDDATPLVHLTLGTVQNRTSRFRVVLDGPASLEVRVLAKVGPNGDPASLGPQPPHVRVERYISQTAVLPRSTVVVSHGGSGTALAALGHGIPQVCLPQAADQFRNALGVTGCGAGLALMPEQATARAISEAVTKVLQDNAFQVNAERVRDQIAAMPRPSAVVRRLEELAAAGPALTIAMRAND